MGLRTLAGGIRDLTQSTGPAQPSLFPDGEELFPFGVNAPAVGAATVRERDTVEEPNPRSLTVAAPTTNETAPTAAVPWFQDYHLVDTDEKFEGFYGHLSGQKRFAFDLETTSLRPLEAEIVGLAFSWRPGEAWYVAVRGPEGAAVLDPTATLERLRPIFEDPAVAKLNQNIKYDLLVLRGRGVEVRGVSGDPMVADYLLHSGERSHNLEELARRYLNHPVVPIEDLIGKKSKKQPQLRMDQVPVDKVAAYSGEDADAAWRLCLHLESRLDGPPLRPLYDDVEVPLIEVLAELEYNGIRLDVPLLKRLSGVMAGQPGRIEKEIYELAGRPFNIGSLPQREKCCLKS